MAGTWDWVLGGVIVLAFVLIIWAKTTKQTIPEIIGGIKDALSNKKEDIEDVTYGYYDR